MKIILQDKLTIFIGILLIFIVQYLCLHGMQIDNKVHLGIALTIMNSISILILLSFAFQSVPKYLGVLYILLCIVLFLQYSNEQISQIDMTLLILILLVSLIKLRIKKS